MSYHKKERRVGFVKSGFVKLGFVNLLIFLVRELRFIKMLKLSYTSQNAAIPTKMKNEIFISALKKCKICYLKLGLNHLALWLAYGLFLTSFAISFVAIEKSAASKTHVQWRYRASLQRQSFISHILLPEIFNNSKVFLFIHDHKTRYLSQILYDRLLEYERKFKCGDDGRGNRMESPRETQPALKASFPRALFYAFSCSSTIGQSAIRAETSKGRMTSVAFSLLGIPFTLLVIKELEKVLLKLLVLICTILCRLFHVFRYCTLNTVTETEVRRNLKQNSAPALVNSVVSIQTPALNVAARLKFVPIPLAILSIIVWVGLGTICMNRYSTAGNGATYELIGYNLINAITTINFGDWAAEDSLPFVVGTIIYTLTALSLISLLINLIHAKFVFKYWREERRKEPRRQPDSDRTGLIDHDAENNTFCDEYETDNFFDTSICSYNTIGIFQTEDRFRLFSEIKCKVDAETQTEPRTFKPRDMDIPRRPIIVAHRDYMSHDDVNSLLRENYRRQRQEWI
ncbi:unnamed protein product [Bursaphelenchus okinawaensis]|uniref:Potassium channel domain-containing protein n=1 Tax=Bursaphelenchus okinawaensis TaxID=465554 RepID=A0A811KB72_9BILA|nr:unnamed protein product [Bursaphelenchus okinawaensis]CAG9096273.1 unnamed protein product [Bursaphelenchus okinawaensis]